MSTVNQAPTCEGCGTRVGSSSKLCVDCAVARYRARARGGRCACGSGKRPQLVHGKVRSSWLCQRCTQPIMVIEPTLRYAGGAA